MSLAQLCSNQLTADLRWREDELAILRKQVFSTTVNSAQEKVYLRASVAMIYAHYEGFCKFALNAYLDALDSQKFKVKDLAWPLATHSLSAMHNALKGVSDRSAFYNQLYVKFNSEIELVANLERLPQISNLWPDLLECWLAKLGLGSKVVNENNLILKSLVTNRNEVAHGKKLPISDRLALHKYMTAASLAMHEVAVNIVESLEKKKYARQDGVYTTFSHLAWM